MVTNGAHCHISRRSIRREFVRITLVSAIPGSPNFFNRCRRTNHPWTSTFLHKLYALETGLGALRGSLILLILSCTKPSKQPCFSLPVSDVRR
jgi:hypothetical protein